MRDVRNAVRIEFILSAVVKGTEICINVNDADSQDNGNISEEPHCLHKKNDEKMHLTKYELRLITSLNENPISASELAAKTLIPRTKIYQVLKNLMRKDLVKRTEKADFNGCRNGCKYLYCLK